MAELYLHSVRRTALSRFEKIRSELAASHETYGHNVCVYATGSFGRLEAGDRSDLDLFIIVETSMDHLGVEKSLLRVTDEIKLKYDLICTAERNGVAKFDGGGRFLTSHTVGSFTEWLGSDQDDYRNTLTGRMLMLLEGKLLIGNIVYEKTVNQVIDRYFRDYEGHEDRFIPAFLLNDIMRMWRTFCVNYEFNRKEGDSRNKIKNLKLKFSRMLTCFSGIVYLLAVYAKNDTVRPADVRTMMSISPTERLEEIATENFGIAPGALSELQSAVGSGIENYSRFLELTHQEIRQAVRKYTADEADWRERSYAFGRSLSSVIDIIGATSQSGDQFRRLILI